MPAERINLHERDIRQFREQLTVEDKHVVARLHSLLDMVHVSYPFVESVELIAYEYSELALHPGSPVMYMFNVPMSLVEVVGHLKRDQVSSGEPNGDTWAYFVSRLSTQPQAHGIDVAVLVSQAPLDSATDQIDTIIEADFGRVAREYFARSLVRAKDPNLRYKGDFGRGETYAKLASIDSTPFLLRDREEQRNVYRAEAQASIADVIDRVMHPRPDDDIDTLANDFYWRAILDAQMNGLSVDFAEELAPGLLARQLAFIEAYADSQTKVGDWTYSIYVESYIEHAYLISTYVTNPKVHDEFLRVAQKAMALQRQDRRIFTQYVLNKRKEIHVGMEAQRVRLARQHGTEE